jgi:hypothetical protein
MRNVSKKYKLDVVVLFPEKECKCNSSGPAMDVSPQATDLQLPLSVHILPQIGKKGKV